MKNSTEFEIVECICAWYDLLGFGQPLMDSNWDLNDQRCKDQLLRLKTLDISFSNKFSSLNGTTNFSLNDGVISNLDIEREKPNFKTRLVLALDDLIQEYEGLNIRDVRAGYPGVRGILTFGHRYNYTYAESSVIVGNGNTVAYHPRVFQMNTAFSKAYIIESSGSRSGVQGNNLYIDEFLFDSLSNVFDYVDGEDTKFIIEKNLSSNQKSIVFTIRRGDTSFLELAFDKDPIPYNYKGIETKLYRFLRRESLQDQLANEHAFKTGQRYLQMEKDEFLDNN